MRTLIIFFFLTQLVAAQNKYTLVGQADQLSADIVYLYYPSEAGYRTDSAKVINKQFRFDGAVDYPVLATLELKDKQGNAIGSTNFYLENSPIRIGFSSYMPVVKNSRTEDLKIEFTKSLLPIQQKMEMLQGLYEQKSKTYQVTQAFKDSIDAQIAIVNQMNEQAIESFVKDHPSDYFSLYLIETLIDNVPNSNKSLVLYDGLTPEIRNSKLGQKIQSRLNSIRNISLGSKAPDFELTDIEGNRFKLSDYSGKYVLLMFWSSECNHCLDELPNIEKLYQQLGGDNLEIIAVAQDHIQNKAQWEAFVKRKGLKWINAFDDRVDGKKKVARMYNVNQLPTNFILNPKGDIIAKDVFGNALLNQLSFILKMSNNNK